MMKLRLFTAIIAVLALVFVPSCKDKDEEVSPNKPVLDENFFYTNLDVNTLVFTTSLSASNMWLTNTATGVSTDFVDDSCKLFIPIMGDYTYTCTALIDGVQYTSDNFSFKIISTNTTFLESGIWKALTGGPTGHKVWKLDSKSFVTTSIGDDGIVVNVTSYKSSLFGNPLDFYGDADAGGAADNIWGPFGGTNLKQWPGENGPEIGTILFDGTTGIVTLKLTDGVNTDGSANVTDSVNAKGEHLYLSHPTSRIGEFKGSFSMVVKNRDANFCTISSKNNGDKGDISLWDYMLADKYKFLRSLSTQTGKLTFSGDLRFPMDKSRVGDEQFDAANLKNVMIVHCSDSALIVRVKRTYDGYSNTTTKKAAGCWLLYHYIVDGFNYGGAVITPLYNTEVVNASATAASIAGTYKFDGLTGEWVNWGTKNTYQSYTAATEASTFAGWGQPKTAEKYAAALKTTVTFNANGTVAITNVTYNATTSAEETNTYNTTYTVNKGYIKFGVAVKITGFTSMLELSGINMYVITTPAAGTAGSLWLGQNNPGKEESVAVQLIKQ